MSELPSFNERVAQTSDPVGSAMQEFGFAPQTTAGHGTVALEKAAGAEDLVWIDRDGDIDGDPEAPMWCVGRWVGNAGVGGEAGYIGVGPVTLQEALRVAPLLPKPVGRDGTHLDMHEASPEAALAAYAKAIGE